MSYTNTLKKAAIAAAAGFVALSTVFQAQTHAYDTGYTPDDAYVQMAGWAPKPGTERYELLKPHEEFIKRMTRNDVEYASCCNLEDAQPDLEEIINTPEENPNYNPNYPQDRYPYIVIVTHDLNGKELPSPQKVHIPADKVLTVDRAQEILDSIINLDPTKDPEINPDSKFLAPSFNVLWAYDNSSRYGTEQTQEPWKITNLFCYYPDPRNN
ncbi:MAG: hypothetical protein MRY79_08580 [Alphaproteobacteria bacterium]|nr:hypothetical protein [Alphaproteobacteria bacterium]